MNELDRIEESTDSLELAELGKVSEETEGGSGPSTEVPGQFP